MVKVRTYRDSLWRRGLVWVLAVGVILTLLAFLTHKPDRVSWFRRPVYAAGNRVAGWLQRATGKVAYAVSGKESRELDKLRQTIELQAAALAAAEEVRLERDRLRALMKMAGCSQADCSARIAARVIAHDPRALFKTIVVDRGAADGVLKGMIVLGGDGLIGRVEVVSQHSSTALLLIDPNHAVDVWVQRTRVRGLLVGSGRNTLMQRLAGVSKVEYLATDADIQADDVVVTTGLDGRYPKGIPVGKVRTVWRGTSGLYSSAEVVPFVDWGAVEEVALLPGSIHE